MSKLLVYEPDKRIRPIDALVHPYFDDLRDENLTFPQGNLLPDLFNFSKFEVEDIQPDNLMILVPQWYREQTGTFMNENEKDRLKLDENNKFLNLDLKSRRRMPAVSRPKL